MIYCVEDERNIRELLVYTLETTGFEAKGMADGEELFQALSCDPVPELILLDIMLPGRDGYAILKELKKSELYCDIPVIMVTAKEEELDKVKGLDGGADDYITKPFGMMEFIARVKAVMRRSRKEKNELLRCGALEMDLKRYEVRENGTPVELTRKEYEVLKYLVENQGIVLTRDQMLEHVWGYDFIGETRTVDVHIRTLRQKLQEAGSMIETVRGVGYRIRT